MASECAVYYESQGSGGCLPSMALIHFHEAQRYTHDTEKAIRLYEHYLSVTDAPALSVHRSVSTMNCLGEICSH